MVEVGMEGCCGRACRGLGLRLQASAEFYPFSKIDLRTVGGTPYRDPCSLWG